MFSSEDQKMLEVANKIVLDKLFSLQKDWLVLVMSSSFDLQKMRDINAFIERCRRENKIFDKILASQAISQAELDLLLAEELLKDHVSLIKKLAFPKRVSETVTPYFVTSEQKLRALLTQPSATAANEAH
jgi:hypothetical protein